MIRLEAFVDDKKVAAVLHALDGLVLNLNVMPVKNAAASKGKVTEAGDPTTGPEVIRKAIGIALNEGRNTISRVECNALGKTYGFSTKGISAAIHNTVHRDHLLMRQAKGVYQIINK